MLRPFALAAVIAVLMLAGCKDTGSSDGDSQAPAAPSGLIGHVLPMG